jgi:hypothetical protein
LEKGQLTVILKIAKGKTAYFVIDSTYGIQVKFSAKRQKDCVKWCKDNGYRYQKGWIW